MDNRLFNSFDCLEFVYCAKCNSECRHCVVSSSPRRKEKLDFDRVMDSLKQFPKFGIKSFAIAGGEPFLFLDELVELCSVASKKGVNFRVVTNGFWASSKKKTDEILSSFVSVGLTNLNVSADDFHSEFIPEKNIFNILESASEKGVRVILRGVLRKGDTPLDWTSKYRKYLGKETNFDFSFQPLMPVGRAAKLKKNSFPLIPFNVYSKIKCLAADADPTIHFDGTFLPCCIPLGFTNSPFVLGDFYENSLEELVNAYRNSLFVFYLINKGPVALVKLAEKNKLKPVNKINNTVKGCIGICDYCIHALGKFSAEDINLLLEEEFEKGPELQALAKKSLRKKRKIVHD